MSINLINDNPRSRLRAALGREPSKGELKYFMAELARARPRAEASKRVAAAHTFGRERCELAARDDTTPPELPGVEDLDVFRARFAEPTQEEETSFVGGWRKRRGEIEQGRAVTNIMRGGNAHRRRS